jgi:hypothetical protein
MALAQRISLTLGMRMGIGIMKKDMFIIIEAVAWGF